MKVNEELISQLVQEKLTGTSNYLVDVYIKPGNKIFVEIDNDNGISIADCVAVSKFLENSLDREAEDFELQVSSPGADQPFKILRQYQKNIGRQVEIITTDDSKITGKLVSANETGIIVAAQVKTKTEHKKSKKIVVSEMELPFEQIKQIKVIISFK